MANPLQEHLIKATEMMENQLDSEIERLDRLDNDDLEALRVRRMDDIKRAAEMKRGWLANGHGEYSEISDEKEFFEACKNSKKVVCHFYRDSTFRCKIIDKHLTDIARTHLETKFIKINAERSQFLVERLRVKTLPTICLAKDGKTVDYIIGFDELGGVDDFPTAMLEWRLGRSDIINYKGDLSEPPTTKSRAPKGKKIFGKTGKTRNLRDDGDSDSDEDW